MKSRRLFLASAFALFTACGGGGSSDPSSESVPPPAESAPPPDASVPMPNIGVFLDSPVINIGYRTETLESATNSLGEFEYLLGDTVTFFIGDLEFPPVEASRTVTALDLAGTTNTSDPRVVNMIRLLQTLDQDANPDNGITITETARSSATQVDFGLSEADFASSLAVTNLIMTAGQRTGLVNNLIDAALPGKQRASKSAMEKSKARVQTGAGVITPVPSSSPVPPLEPVQFESG